MARAQSSAEFNRYTVAVEAAKADLRASHETVRCEAEKMRESSQHLARAAKLASDTAAFLRRAPSRSVLIVDDEPDIIYLIDLLVREIEPPVEVETASTCAGARALMRAQCFGVAVIDVMLPDGNGWELAEEMPRRTGVIMISGSVGKVTLNEVGLKSRADAAFVKPLDNVLLVEAVKRLLPATTEPRP